MKDLSHLPKAAPDAGMKPDPEPKWGHIVAVSEQDRPDKPIALGTPFRYSSAGDCARKLSYHLAGVKKEPIDLGGLHVMRLGTILHEDWQRVLEGLHPTVQIEVSTGIDGLVSGSCDALLDSHVLELKSKGGFGFKLAIGDRGPAQGPSTPNVIQLALNVVGCDATGGTLVMVATEAISKGAAAKKKMSDAARFVGEWTFTREQLQPYADKEVERLRLIQKLHEDGELAPRHVPYEMPPGARITDVSKSAWQLTDDDGNVTDTGTIWGGQFCTYCAFQDHCKGVE
jgi:hypothetical protein